MTAYLEYEGAPVPAHDLVWYDISPCGCTGGVMTTDAGPNGMLLVTEDQAWENGCGSSKAVRDLERKQGSRMELGLRADVTTRLGNDCPHTPKWGVETTPTPAGHQWAHAGGRARSIHLVPGEPVDYRISVKNWRDDDKITALCGAQEYSWDAFPGLRSDYLECGKCATAARAGQVQL